MDRNYYLDKYLAYFETCMESAKGNGSDDVLQAANDIFEDTADAEQVVGYYIHVYRTEAYERWNDNLCYFEKNGGTLSQQDKEVSEILKGIYLCDKQ